MTIGPNRSRYREARRERVRGAMERHGVEAALMRLPANFAWYTGGGNSRVEYAAALGAADVVLTRDDEWVLASTIEAPRMRDEEATDLEVVEYPWHEGPEAKLSELIGEARLGADVPLGDALDLSGDLDALRRVLDAAAIARLREVGADLTDALEEASRQVLPGLAEHEVAEAIAAQCRDRGLVPTVLLAATDERIRRYRHPLPTSAQIERRAMLVASAQRGGLYANLTRIVQLDDPDPETARRQAVCDEILARMRDEATTCGRTLADAFADCQRFYAEAGFADEWRLHHQGGITGYASREVIATPHTRVPLQPGQAFAWNPSVTGAKAEETFVLSEHGAEVVAGAQAAAEAV